MNDPEGDDWEYIVDVGTTSTCVAWSKAEGKFTAKAADCKEKDKGTFSIKITLKDSNNNESSASTF